MIGPIEKNVPMPASFRKKFPWGEMEVGDSFLTDNAHIYVNANQAKNRIGAKFSVRKQPDGKFRVWRIA